MEGEMSDLKLITHYLRVALGDKATGSVEDELSAIDRAFDELSAKIRSLDRVVTNLCNQHT
jgi:hypothetical protein